MKSLLRLYLAHLFALWLATQVLHPAFTIEADLINYLLAATILSVLNLLLKPILKLLFFPVNTLTLGLFTWVINAAIFYFFVNLVPSVSITPWKFPGITLAGIVVPEIQLSFWATLFVASFIVSVITNFITYLAK